MFYKLFLICLICTRINLYAEDTSSILEDAYKSYQSGENAKTIIERQRAFNKSLKLYSQLEDTYHPNFGDGKLFYNLANSYFQVEEYPLAIYYYKKALQLMPRSDKVKQNLVVAQQKAGLPSSTIVSLYDQVFFFHSKFSLPERLKTFFLLSVLLIALIAVKIWNPQYKLKFLITLVAVCSIALLISVLYTSYFAPMEAVLVKASPLYKDAGTQYATVSELPILGGSTVQVLAIKPDGQWLKILAPSGDLGYVPSTAIKII